jgi:hypothetical protein
MRSRRIQLALATVTVAIASVTAAAPAMGGVAPGSKDGVINPFKVGDYKVRVDAFGDRASAEVDKGAQFVSYNGPATKVEPDHIKGDFGKFGKIDMRFHKSGPFKAQKLPHGCTGSPEKKQKGVWNGTVKLQSEKHMVKTTKHELKGSITKAGNLDCGPTDLRQGITLQSGGNDFLFAAFKPQNKGKVQVFALTGGPKGGADITRGNFATESRSDFQAASDLSSATLKGQAPFSGFGHFTQSTGPRGGTSTQGTLTGNLKGGFLGLDGKIAFESSNAFLTDGTLIRSRFEQRFRAVR